MFPLPLPRRALQSAQVREASTRSELETVLRENWLLVKNQILGLHNQTLPRHAQATRTPPQKTRVWPSAGGAMQKRSLARFGRGNGGVRRPRSWAWAAGLAPAAPPIRQHLESRAVSHPHVHMRTRARVYTRTFTHTYTHACR